MKKFPFFYIKKQERRSEHQIFKKSEEGDTYEKIVVDIESLLLQWINRRDKEDAIRVLRGGPGYGKSSLLKILAAKLASQDKKVLFIPLHRFDLKDDLNRALRDFLAYDRFLSFNPLDEKDTLIIFFDGLDELSMQGMALAEAANKFVQELAKEVLNYNARQLRLQVILSGRDIIIQQNEAGFRKEEQVLGVVSNEDGQQQIIMFEQNPRYKNPFRFIFIIKLFIIIIIIILLYIFAKKYFSNRKK